jgi:hypothetical protein
LAKLGHVDEYEPEAALADEAVELIEFLDAGVELFRAAGVGTDDPGEQHAAMVPRAADGSTATGDVNETGSVGP